MITYLVRNLETGEIVGPYGAGELKDFLAGKLPRGWQVYRAVSLSHDEWEELDKC